MVYVSLRIYSEKRPLLKYCVIKHLILLKTQNMIDSKEVLLQWFMIFFEQKSSGGDIKKENMLSQELSKELD